VSRYQKGNTNLDFTEARDSEWQWHQLGLMQVCTSLQTVITTPVASYYVVHKLEFQATSVKAADKSYYRLRCHTFRVFDTDLSPYCVRIQPMSQQRADAAGMDFIHVMLYHCVWCMDQIIL